MTYNELTRRFPKASHAFYAANSVATELPDSKSEQASGSKQVQSDEVKKGSKGRFRVRITRFGTRLLDADNLAGGCKPIIDQLRYSNLIRNDDPASLVLEICQIKSHKKYIGTLIEIYPI